MLFRLLRGGVLASIVLIALPFLFLMGLGAVWLWQTGYFLEFSIGAMIVTLIAASPIWLRQWRSRRIDQNSNGVMDVDVPSVDANPDWSEREKRIFNEICRDIATRIPEAQSWPLIQGLALEVAESTARKVSDGRKGALDFSIPEALLLSDRILLRLRAMIRDTLPLADQISIGTLYWAWQKRVAVQTGAKYAGWGARAIRTIADPANFIMQEIQKLIVSGAWDFVSKRTVMVVQRIILEEIAHASIELHSGRLRFSDEELLEIQLGSEIADRNALAQPDVPLRLLVIGQVSAGKSTLINALADAELAETDMAASTPGLTRYDLVLEGLPFCVIDTQGIDGSKTSEDQILEQMLDCDMILWAVRANRPARSPDVALMERFQTILSSDHRRRKPPVLIALTAIDSLVSGWPFPENLLPDDKRQIVADIVHSVSSELNTDSVVPVCADQPAWNVNVLAEAISDQATEALMTQRNRRRLQGESEQSTWSAEAGRLREGVSQTANFLWSRVKKD